VKSDSVHICTETFFIFQEIRRAKSDAGASMQFDRRPMALPYLLGRRLEGKEPFLTGLEPAIFRSTSPSRSRTRYGPKETIRANLGYPRPAMLSARTRASGAARQGSALRHRNGVVDRSTRMLSTFARHPNSRQDPAKNVSRLWLLVQ
jgi:hypothetical protein